MISIDRDDPARADAPARRLYARNGFTECPAFAGYTLDPNSVFMELFL